MVLSWLPLDEVTVDAMCDLARSAWEPDSLDTAWGLTGWPTPDGAPISRLVFERMRYSFDTGERLVGLAMRFDPDQVRGFFTDFAAFYHAADPEDPNLADLVHPQGIYAGWRVDPDAGRSGFDTVWREGCRAVGKRLGVPGVVGQHGERWRHAVWRIGARLLAVAQGEEFGSLGAYDAAALWTLDFSTGGKIPSGDELYSLLTGP